MATWDGLGHTFDQDCVNVGNAIELRLVDLRYAIVHREEFRTRDDRRVAIVFGISSPFGGSNPMSLWMEEARYVAFLIRIEELAKASTEVKVWAGGAQGVMGFDYGRNAGVAQKILEGVAKGIGGQ